MARMLETPLCALSSPPADSKVILTHQGYQLGLDSRLMAEMLNPQVGSPPNESLDNNLLFLQLAYCGTSFILTIDIE